MRVFTVHTSYNLKGIGNGTIKTLGFIIAALFIQSAKISHDFHIVDDSFPIPCDGIIGIDFIKNFNCALDYQSNGPSWFVIRPDSSNRQLQQKNS